jgi:hypothetical protein
MTSTLTPTVTFRDTVETDDGYAYLHLDPNEDLILVTRSRFDGTYAAEAWSDRYGKAWFADPAHATHDLVCTYRLRDPADCGPLLFDLKGVRAFVAGVVGRFEVEGVRVTDGDDGGWDERAFVTDPDVFDACGVSLDPDDYLDEPDC